MSEHPESVQQLFDEHQHLRDLLESVRASVAAPQSSAAVSEMIGELAGQVTEHFRQEEAGGYFTDVIQHAPRLASRVASLQKQHSLLADQLERLRQQAARTPPGGDAWQDLTGSFEQFCVTFNKHELAENQLLQQAYTDDIGVDD